jgi:hypothetical protein
MDKEAGIAIVKLLDQGTDMLGLWWARIRYAIRMDDRSRCVTKRDEELLVRLWPDSDRDRRQR